MRTDTKDVPLRKRVTQQQLAKLGRQAAKFLNRQFALIAITFFVLSLNVVSAPVVPDAAALNPLINYDPNAVADSSRAIDRYVPVINQLNPDQVSDQVLSAVVGPQTAYVPTPFLADTIDHQTADRIRRGLRKETVTHEVAQGETLSKIARDYGLNTATLLEANHLKPEEAAKLKPGTQLVIVPENTTDSLDWLNQLHQVEQRVRDQKLKDRSRQLAKNRKDKFVLSSAIAQEAGNAISRFLRPIIGARTCYNGYHLWAIDCPAPVGSSVIAAAGGTISIADPSGYNGGYGKTVVISHGNGWETRYAHMSNVEVVDGERVAAGEEIGKSGNSGNSTGPHLHFETHFNGQRINPITLIP